MSDEALVDRLRHGVATYDDMADAAARMEAQEAEITRLRARVAELEGALRDARARYVELNDKDAAEAMVKIITEALGDVK